MTIVLEKLVRLLGERPVSGAGMLYDLHAASRVEPLDVAWAVANVGLDGVRIALRVADDRRSWST